VPVASSAARGRLTDPSTWRAELGEHRQETIVFLCALALGCAHILMVARDVPFWIDETYSGVIATQTTLKALFDWCRNEAGGPVYYAFLWLWEKVAGSTNYALRLPSMAFMFCAPLSIIFFAKQERRLTLVWAALVAIWTPGLMSAAQARPYALLYLFSCIQAVSFLALVQEPSRRRAFGWTCVSSLLLLTHLHAIVITAIQGMMLAVLHRKHAKSLWPSLLPFLTFPAWMLFQLPMLLRLANAETFWYPTMGWNVYLVFSDVFMGPGFPALVITTFTLVMALRIGFGHLQGRQNHLARADILLAGSGFIAMILVLIQAYQVPAFTHRYMIPYLPAALLGVAIATQAATQRYRLAPTIIVGLLAVSTLKNLIDFSAPHSANRLLPLEAESGSNWLASRGATRVIFAWDNPVAKLNDPSRLGEVAGFFLKRAHHPAKVESVIVPPGARALEPLAQFALERNAAILWIGGEEYPSGFETQLKTNCKTWSFPRGHSIACEAPGHNSAQRP
jgi:Dolichyl-phosphate-mannose-protein mannosyltransferase